MNYLRVELLITTVAPTLRLETLSVSLVKNTSIKNAVSDPVVLPCRWERNPYTPLPIAVSSIYKVETTIESMRTPRYNGGNLDLSLIFTFRIHSEYQYRRF